MKNNTLLLFREKGQHNWQHYYEDGKPKSLTDCELSAMTTVKYREADWLFVDISKSVPYNPFKMVI